MNLDKDRRIRIEQGTASKDSKGAAVITWAHFETVWAEWREVQPSRSEAVRTGLQTARDQVRVRIDYLAGLTSEMRVVHQGVNYNIVGGPAELGRKEVHEIVLERYSS